MMCWPTALMSSMGFSRTNQNQNCNFHAKEILNETGYPQLNWGESGLVLITDFFLDLIKVFDTGLTSVTFMFSI